MFYAFTSKKIGIPDDWWAIWNLETCLFGLLMEEESRLSQFSLDELGRYLDQWLEKERYESFLVKGEEPKEFYRDLLSREVEYIYQYLHSGETQTVKSLRVDTLMNCFRESRAFGEHFGTRRLSQEEGQGGSR